MRILLFIFLLGIPALAAPKDSVTVYSPVGKRDPFRSPTTRSEGRDVAAVLPIERFALEQFQLRAILRGLGKPRAMFEDPEGKTHIVMEGAVIGRERGTVSRILDSDVIITEQTFNYLGQESLFEKVISLPKDNSDFELSGSALPASPSSIRAPSGENLSFPQIPQQTQQRQQPPPPQQQQQQRPTAPSYDNIGAPQGAYGSATNSGTGSAAPAAPANESIRGNANGKLVY